MPKTIAASGINADRHVSKYLNDKHLNTLHFTAARTANGLVKGEQVKIDSVQKIGDRYFATVTRCDAIVVPVSVFEKPKVGLAGQSEAQTRTETLQINKLREDLNTFLVTVDPLPLKIGSRTVNAFCIEQVGGTGLKPDFVIKDQHGTVVHFGSLKKSHIPELHNGYGGLSKEKTNNIVQAALNGLRDHISKNDPGKYFYELDPNNAEHNQFISRTAFGYKHGEQELTEHNIHAVHHGSTRIFKFEQFFTLKSDWDWYNTGYNQPSISELQSSTGRKVGIGFRPSSGRLVTGSDLRGYRAIIGPQVLPPKKLRNGKTS